MKPLPLLLVKFCCHCVLVASSADDIVVPSPCTSGSLWSLFWSVWSSFANFGRVVVPILSKDDGGANSVSRSSSSSFFLLRIGSTTIKVKNL